MPTPAPTLVTHEVTAAVLDVDRTLAEEMLRHNPDDNRVLKRTVVEQFKRDMVSGAWRMTGEAIKFDKTGTLSDGQHRLEALVRAAKEKPGMVIKMMVITGLEPEVREVMDQGSRRTAGDVLSMEGASYGPLSAAVIRQCLLVERGDVLSGGNAVSTSEILAWKNAHPEIVDFIRDTANAATKFPASASVLLAAVWMMREVDATDAMDFFEGLTQGTGLGNGDPRLVLYRRFAEMRFQQITARKPDVMGFAIQAWNAYREKRTVMKFQRPKSGWTRENFPTPK